MGAVIMSGLNEGTCFALRAEMSADEKAKQMEVATRVVDRLASDYPGTPAYKVASLCGIELDPKPNWMQICEPAAAILQRAVRKALNRQRATKRKRNASH